MSNTNVNTEERLRMEEEEQRKFAKLLEQTPEVEAVAIAYAAGKMAGMRTKETPSVCA